MSPAVLLLVPLGAAALLVLVRRPALGAALNVAATLAAFLAALPFLFARPEPGPLFLVDELNVLFLVTGLFVSLTTSLFSAGYIGHELAQGRFTAGTARVYHAMFQVLVFAMNLALLANNLGVMWVAVELATLTTVTMVGLYRTHAALEAAWKYFILGSVGIALALFGTILAYMAGQAAAGGPEGEGGILWSRLMAVPGGLDPGFLSLAFAFVLLGYGTKVGLVPLHGWLPDAHAEGPTPISAVLSGLLLNVALHAVLRFRMLLAGTPGAIDPGPLMMLMGLLSLLTGALMLYRRRDLKRLFAWSSIEHMGIIVFAFGMGGAVANFAGLLHMVLHSLTKSAIFFAVGHAAQVAGSQRIAEVRGLTASHPGLGWALVAGTVAIAGLPPFGLFMSEFLIATEAFARAPLLAAAFLLGLLLALGALLLRLHEVGFGPPSAAAAPFRPALVPLVLHLLLVLVAGLWLPPVAVDWLRAVAERLG